MAELNEAQLRKALWEEANRIVIDATYSGRSHQSMGVRWEKIDRWTGVPATILGAVGSAAAGVSAIADGEVWLTATLALTAAGLTAVRSFLRSDEIAKGHGLKGDRLINLKSDAFRFQQIDLTSGLTLETLQGRLADLSLRRNALRESEPHHIPRPIYKATKKGIEAGESDYENDHLWLESPY